MFEKAQSASLMTFVLLDKSMLCIFSIQSSQMHLSTTLGSFEVMMFPRHLIAGIKRLTSLDVKCLHIWPTVAG